MESGYADNMDEYSNDLYVRLWFDDLLPLVTPVAAAWLREHLEPVDDRFMAATTEPLRPFHGEGRWHRVPRVLVGCLREKFIRMGVAPEGAGLPPGPDRP